jgi:antitoxin component YwqK of YwqJK toxin-antitoxin module
MSKNNQYNEKGQRHGLWKFYFDNGQLWEKGTYVNGKPHGMWKHYNRDSKIKKQVFYSKYYEQN